MTSAWTAAARGHTVPPGVYGALATPLDERGQVDEPALARLVDRMVRGGVDGISPVGSTGEGPRLSAAQRLTVTALVCRQVPEPMPVLAGIPVAGIAEALGDLDRAAMAGATAALVTPPSYYPLSDEDLFRLYARLAETSPLPLLLYNIPVFTKALLDPVVVGRLADLPRIVGIKDSGGDLGYLREVLAATAGSADFTVFTGTDRLLVPSLELGAHGTIAASVNLAPHLAVGIYHDFTAGRIAEAEVAQHVLGDLVTACRAGGFPAGWKSALHYAGVCRPYLAPPAAPLADEPRRELWRRLADLGVDPGPGTSRGSSPGTAAHSVGRATAR